MARQAALLNLAYRLSQAAVERDWAELARVDAEIAAQLPRLIARGNWTPAEQQTLRGLRDAHREALALCVREADRLDARLVDMCAHKDGWLAYAMNTDDDTQENPA